MAFVVVPEYWDDNQEAFVFGNYTEAQQLQTYYQENFGRKVNILPIRALPVAFRVKRLYEQLKNGPPILDTKLYLEEEFGDIL